MVNGSYLWGLLGEAVSDPNFGPFVQNWGSGLSVVDSPDAKRAEVIVIAP